MPFALQWCDYRCSTLISAEWIKIPCHRKDPKVNECLKNTFQGMFPFMARGTSSLQRKKVTEKCYLEELTHFDYSSSRKFDFYSGIPEVNIPRFEPLFIEKIGITKGHGAVTLAGNFNHLYAHGPSNTTTIYTSWVKNLIFEFGYPKSHQK